MRNPRVRLLGVAALVLALGASPIAAQIPDKFTNLKVLPKDIDRRQMLDTMRGFSGALGVHCDFCHVEQNTASSEKMDFASDEKEHKKTARAMMQMVGQINGQLLPATGLKSPMQVRCVTCHRGLEKPATLGDVLLEETGKGGAGAAEARYRELRKQYYGSGSYDFSPRSLDEVAQSLASDKNDVDGAIALTKLNLEFNPDSASSHLVLAQLYSAKGDQAAAVAAAEKALALDPENRRAKQMLERLRSAK